MKEPKWTVDMQSFAKDNDGFKYVLAVLDTFSKYGFIVPLKDKTRKSTADGFAKILASSGRKAGKIWVDKGREFYNKDDKKLVELYSTENEEKSCVVERWNRTVRDRMFKYFSANSTRKYIDILDAHVDQYNSKVHPSIKMTPGETSLKKNKPKVWRNLHPDGGTEVIVPKFSIGHKIRITLKKVFLRNLTPHGGLKKYLPCLGFNTQTRLPIK